MKRTGIATPPWVVPPAPKVSRSEIDRKLRDLLWTRCGGLCELCGERLPFGGWQAHHRKLKGQGGQEAAHNLVALHILDHRRCHMHVRWAKDHGFIVSAAKDPAARPLALGLNRWVLLTSAGEYLDCDPPGEAA